MEALIHPPKHGSRAAGGYRVSGSREGVGAGCSLYSCVSSVPSVSLLVPDPVVQTGMVLYHQPVDEYPGRGSPD